jgi:hypothetical protein
MWGVGMQSTLQFEYDLKEIIPLLVIVFERLNLSIQA